MRKYDDNACTLHSTYSTAVILRYIIQYGVSHTINTAVVILLLPVLLKHTI